MPYLVLASSHHHPSIARTKRARINKCSGGPDLPQEILYYILLLLPAKSLMRCRSVSKLWLSIISDPQFISSFFNSGHPKLLLIVPQSPHPDGYPSGQFIFSIDNSECCRAAAKMTPPPLSLTATSRGLVPRKRVQNVQVSHSSGGLVCIEFRYRFVVCNPSTREYIVNIPSLPVRSSTHKYINHFGFDPVENKYKILSTLQLNGERFYLFVITLGVEEGWRALDGGYPTSYLSNEFSTQVQHHGAGVCINGVIYYLSMQNHNLIAFDVRLETFKVIPLPADAVGLSNSFLMESDGCVALVNMIDDDDIQHDYLAEPERRRRRRRRRRRGQVGDVKDEIPVYTPKDVRNQVWISERFAVPDDLRKLIQTVTLVGTTLKGELLYATSINNSSGKCNLYVCNLKDSSLRQIEVGGLPKDQIYPPGIQCLRVCNNYVENLISLKSYNLYVERF